jgi:hypothetical protein
MADASYLIALALLEQGEGRALPLQGKSLREPLAPDAVPGAVGHQLALDLLMRVWQRSDQGPLQRAAADHSLLLITVPIEALQEQLPALKAAWLNTGDTSALLQGLRPIASGVWSLALEPRQPITYQRLG